MYDKMYYKMANEIKYVCKRFIGDQHRDSYVYTRLRNGLERDVINRVALKCGTYINIFESIIIHYNACMIFRGERTKDFDKNMEATKMN